MSEQDEQLLCDYIFDLLDENESKDVETLLLNSADHRRKFNELNAKFNGLKTLKDDYKNPLNSLKNRIYKFSMVAAILIGSIISLGAMNDAPQKTVSTVTTVNDKWHNDTYKQAAIKCHVSSLEMSKKFAFISIKNIEY